MGAEHAASMHKPHPNSRLWIRQLERTGVGVFEVAVGLCKEIREQGKANQGMSRSMKEVWKLILAGPSRGHKKYHFLIPDRFCAGPGGAGEWAGRCNGAC